MAKKGRIGLDIGSTAVRAVELLGSPPTVVRASQVALPAGAVESGEVRDPGAVSDALQQAVVRGRVQGPAGLPRRRQPARGRARDLAARTCRRRSCAPRSGSRSRSSSRCRSTTRCSTTTRSASSSRTTARCSGCSWSRRNGAWSTCVVQAVSRRPARAARDRPGAVRARALDRRVRPWSRPRGRAGRGGDRRHRRARDQHRRARRVARRGSSASCRAAAATSRSRSRDPRGSRTTSPSV